MISSFSEYRVVITSIFVLQLIDSVIMCSSHSEIYNVNCLKLIDTSKATSELPERYSPMRFLYHSLKYGAKKPPWEYRQECHVAGSSTSTLVKWPI